MYLMGTFLARQVDKGTIIGKEGGYIAIFVTRTLRCFNLFIGHHSYR